MVRVHSKWGTRSSLLLKPGVPDTANTRYGPTGKVPLFSGPVISKVATTSRNLSTLPVCLYCSAVFNAVGKKRNAQPLRTVLFTWALPSVYYGDKLSGAFEQYRGVLLSACWFCCCLRPSDSSGTLRGITRATADRCPPATCYI